MHEKTTVRKLIMALMEYNMDAEFKLFVNNLPIEQWSLTYGSKDGVKKETADIVSIDIAGGESDKPH